MKSLFSGKWAAGNWTALWLGIAVSHMNTRCEAQTSSPPTLPPGVQDVVKLVKAGLNEEVVLAQIRHAGAYYNLSADQIIYLHDQGVAQSEISALLGNAAGSVPPGPAPSPATPTVNAPVAAPATTAPSSPPAPYAPPQIVAPVAVSPAPPGPAPAEPASLDSFRGQLTRYGTWMEVPGYGLCWRPSLEATDPFWRPYCDQGYWAYTADGWTWQSQYPWGDIVFHYGRWYRDSIGWIWVPGYDWAPAWVCWRQADGYCGWAPLPPAAVFRAGVGLWFGGRVALDVDFGLGADAFTFVAYDHFWDHHLHAYLLPREQLRVVFGHSVVLNGYRLDHGRFVVEGLGRDHLAMLTHHEIRVEHREADFRDHWRMDRGRDRDGGRDWRGR